MIGLQCLSSMVGLDLEPGVEEDQFFVILCCLLLFCDFCLTILSEIFPLRIRRTRGEVERKRWR